MCRELSGIQNREDVTPREVSLGDEECRRREKDELTDARGEEIVEGAFQGGVTVEVGLWKSKSWL
jgi:hypothetical protein